jgi:ATP-dependent helicase HrpB
MSLPIDSVLPQLLQTLQGGNTLVLQAPPGTGKTTRVPLALLHAGFLGDKRIVMLEPRRLAARSAARYMASLLGEEAGQTVGYRTRLDTRIGKTTRIEVVTEGILSRLLQEDAELSRYGVVIFDEFHERSLQADLGLALVRECQQVLREDLRLLVMSATLNVAPLAQLLGGAPVIHCEAQSWPVDIRYASPGATPLEDFLPALLLRLLREETGSLLVFLPGEGEIRRLVAALENRLPDDALLAPLYGQLSGDAQDLAISPAPAGKRKLVLATAIAETSLTIEGIRIVVDGGQLRQPRYDPGSAMTRLVTTRLSAANAEQRKGRAGRLGPGMCVRLWSEEENSRLQPFAPPEIQQADLTGTVLELAAWGVRDPATLAWLDQPPAANWAQALQLLQQLEALDASGSITPHGKSILQLGLPPRLGHMVWRGRELGFSKLAADLAALLAERDLLPRDRGTDLHARLAVLRGEHPATGVDRNRLQLVREGARRLQQKDQRDQPESNDALGMLLALAFPDHIASRRPGKSPRYLLSNGRGALLRDDDALAGESWLVAADMDGQAREARIFLAASVSQAALEEVLAPVIKTVDVLEWDAATQSVQARRQRKLDALVLEDKPLQKPVAAAIRAVMLREIRLAGTGVFPWSEALRQLQARVVIMHALEPEAWPDFSESGLLATLEDWASPFLDGVSRFSHLAAFPLHDALLARLDWAQQQRLDDALPTRLTVPSGSSVAIDYTAEHGPVLGVKLQEMFGLTTTPQLARGRVPLTIHLLSPAQRPVAVTSDLASFWKNAYADVRKDLRGRYPRHPWPEDPLTAVAQRGVKKRPEGS